MYLLCENIKIENKHKQLFCCICIYTPFHVFCCTGEQRHCQRGPPNQRDHGPPPAWCQTVEAIRAGPKPWQWYIYAIHAIMILKSQLVSHTWAPLHKTRVTLQWYLCNLW